MTIEITVKSDKELNQAQRHQIKRTANVLMQNGNTVNITWPDKSHDTNPIENHYTRETITHY